MLNHYWRWALDVGWFIFLLILLRHFWLKRSELLASAAWLTTKGRITRCEWATEGNILWPKIEYVYQVNEQELTGEYLFIDTAHNTPTSKYSREVAYKAAVAFQNHAEIDVFYNPNDPKQSAMDISIPRKLNVIIVLIGAAIVAHLVMIGLRVWHG